MEKERNISEEYNKALELLKANNISLNLKPRTAQERNEVIKVLYGLGMDYGTLSKLYTVSRQRIAQILVSLGVVREKEDRKLEKATKKYEERIAKLKARLKHSGEMFAQEHIKVLQLQNLNTLKDNKLAKVENFTQQLEEYRYKNLHLSSQLGKAKIKIANLESTIKELQKEIKEVKGQKKTFIVKRGK